MRLQAQQMPKIGERAAKQAARSALPSAGPGVKDHRCGAGVDAERTVGTDRPARTNATDTDRPVGTDEPRARN
ncbi:hypothetical protein, partial [Asanoa iriomotensis]|uniref:hypothetical protein n=1 Tax=Asanoa iriomotensis TaxID=234613 RepID=UPI001945026D